ncbi:MAG: hypothetical protein K2M17_06140, partial [Bacilli bacterium]|nr:hypothetical protein [Bacilli bacterium]
MAKKFFNQKIPNTQKTVTQIIIVVVCIIGIIVCFCFASYFNNKPHNEAVISLRDSVAIEVNSPLPDKTTFFSELANVEEDKIEISYEKVNNSKVGEYEVTIKLYNKKYKSKLLVVDSISPVLTLKDVTINAGETYKAEDFIESCTDNSKEDCKVEFYTLAIDQEGNKIDYSNYQATGNYKIQIVASDTSNNTSVVDTTLTIGEGTPINPVCQYGNNEYDTAYILAVDITENGCAINEELHQDETVTAAVRAIMESETEKLKKEFSKLNGSGTITLNRNISAVRNKAGTGIVGYSLLMELAITKNGNTELAESYYLDLSGKRIFSV